MSPRRTNKPAQRAAILQAALDIAQESGWANVTMRRVAERIDYTAPIIYEHFADKEAMLQALMIQGHLDLTATLQSAYDKYEDPRERLIALGNAYWAQAWSNIERYLLMHGQGGIACEPISLHDEDAIRIVTQGIETYFRDKITHDEAVLLFISLWSMLHGTITLVVSGTINKQAGEQALQLAFEWLLNGGKDHVS